MQEETYDDTETYFDMGNQFLQAKDYGLVLHYFKFAAEHGNTEAQYKMGLMYEHGYGVDKNDIEAFKWYEKAAIHGNHNSAQGNLGIGRGVTKDYLKAFEWLQKASQLDYSPALNHLATMYLTGDGIPKNEKKAFELFQRAAEQNDARAQENMGWLYENGYGVTQNYTKAREWYERAAEQGDPLAKQGIERINRLQNEEPQTTNLADWYRLMHRQRELEIKMLNYGCSYSYIKNVIDRAREDYIRKKMNNSSI